MQFVVGPDSPDKTTENINFKPTCTFTNQKLFLARGRLVVGLAVRKECACPLADRSSPLRSTNHSESPRRIFEDPFAMSTQKRLLIIGLLNAPPSESPFSTATLAHLKETVQAEIRKTKEAGYEVDVSLCDDRHFDNALLVSLSHTANG